MRYEAKVMFNGNHYFYGQVVKGSLTKWIEGITYLYDDEENYIKGIGDFTRYEWVAVFEDSLKEIK